MFDNFDRISHIYDWLPIPTHPDAVRDAIGSVEGLRVDLGGGTGRFTRRIHGAGPDVFVVDASRAMLTQARTHEGTLHLVQGAGQRLPFPDDAVGAISVTEAFHHFAPEQREVLADTARVLHQDGVLAIEEIDPRRFLGRTVEIGEHVIGFDSNFLAPDALTRLAEASFDDVTVEPSGWFTYVLQARDPSP